MRKLLCLTLATIISLISSPLHALAPKANDDTRAQLAYFEAALRLAIHKHFGQKEKLENIAYDAIVSLLNNGGISLAPLRLETNKKLRNLSLAIINPI